MREEHSQVVLLVRAFEEGDPEGHVLPLHSRTAATRRTLEEERSTGITGNAADSARAVDARAVIRRADTLADELTGKLAFLPGLLRVTRLTFGATPWVVAVALVAGLTTNLLGPRHQVNLLASPVLGVLAWNFLVYLAVAIGFAWHRKDTRPGARAPLTRGLSSFVAGVLPGGLARWRIRRGGTGITAVTAKAITSFSRFWTRAAGPLLSSRVRRTLHLGAMALAIGAVGGMYVRGIAFEYRATWESTWLNADQAQSILNLVLGPAAFVLGTSVPDVAPLREASANAAPWIHLHAVAVLLYVILPRTALALFEAWRCRRFAGSVPVDLGDGYFRKMFSGRRGASTKVDIVPYSFSPEPTVADRLKTVLHDFFGARADIRMLPALEYGDDAGTSVAESVQVTDEGEKGRKTCRVVLFNLAQSPESEVHGEFLGELKDRVAGDRGELLVLLDSSAYRKRVDSPDRLAERRRAWTRVAKESGLSVVSFDADAQDGGMLDDLGPALWSAERAARVGR